MSDRPRFTVLGKAISFLLVIGLVALGAFMLMRGGAAPTGGGTAEPDDAEGPGVSEVQVDVPRLSPPAPFNYKDNIVPIEISEYAGYAGLIAANGGLEPTENSYFFKNHGFKVRLTISEDEDWSELAQPLVDAIKEHVGSGEAALGPDFVPPEAQPEDAVVSRIQRILEDEVRPAVAMDGGDVVFAGFRDGVVEVYLQGSCVGCPSSTATLKFGIEARLREEIPEVTEVVAL